MNCVQINYNIMIFNCYQLIVVALCVLQLLGTLFGFSSGRNRLAGEDSAEQRFHCFSLLIAVTFCFFLSVKNVCVMLHHFFFFLLRMGGFKSILLVRQEYTI